MGGGKGSHFFGVTEIKFKKGPTKIHAITLGTVRGHKKYSNICFQLFKPTGADSTEGRNPQTRP